MATDPRPLSARIDAYIGNLQSIVSQLTELADTLDDAGHDSSPVRDGVKLYGIIIDDLTKVVNGEQLQAFEVTGEL